MPPLTRRSLLLALAPRPAKFRWAICSETFAGMPFPDACRAAARCGYAGIEVEPAHLGPDPVQLPPGARKEIRQVMAAAGLQFTGLHNALKAPAGLHLTSADAVRQFTTSLRHVHLNELDGRYPGAADYPFLPILQALRDIRYPGWVSVEVFDFKPDGETVARRALEHLRKLEASLP
ncbi:MAG: sugar phosphate isomerase/epimerase family protein [bacterium]